LCFTMLPPILAHAGLATTDMALTAMTGASFLTALIWLERPSLPYSLLFGAATALAVLSKFSALVFLPAAMGAALIWHVLTRRGPWRWAWGQYLSGFCPGFCVAASIGALLIWAAYRFSFGAVSFTSLRLPAPELYAGIQQVIEHNRRGDPAYLLGGHSQSGWWYFYLVALAVKTPLPFLGLLIYGIAARKRGAAWVALVFSLGILVAASFSHINLGIRHALPVYLGFSIVAGAGAARLFERARTTPLAGWVLSGLVIWLAAASAFSHPDYLPYFNVLAGAEPERILVDSDLDWGQDMKRLARRLHEAGATAVSFTPFNHADLAAQGFPPAQPNDPLRPAPGWNAVSLTFLKNARMSLGDERPEIKLWPEQIKPTEKIGKGIWLWYFPPDAVPAR
jgi:4-amino-4-deoxy-L-arabinose transferase-like glycosyltransferase